MALLSEKKEEFYDEFLGLDTDEVKSELANSAILIDELLDKEDQPEININIENQLSYSDAN